MTEPKTDDPMIAGLLREREGYVQRGLDDRVAQVDEQLSLRGYTEPTEKPADLSGQESSAGQRAAKTSARSPRAGQGHHVRPRRGERVLDAHAVEVVPAHHRHRP